MNKLSNRENQLLEFITAYIETQKCAPALTEMAAALDVHQSTVREYLNRLIKKGYVVRDYAVVRGLKVIVQE